MVRVNIIKIILIIISINFFYEPGFSKDQISNKDLEIKKLNEIIQRALKRIKNASNVRAGDFLKLLPNVTVSKRAPYEGMKEAETYYSLSLSTSQLHYINIKNNERIASKRKAKRKIESIRYKIKKIIEKKYLVKSQIWQLAQIKRSTKNPVRIADIDNKINNLSIKLKDINITIEDYFSEIEYVCIEIEG